MISNGLIIRTLFAIQEGRINPMERTYIFKDKEDRHVGIDAIDIRTAQQICILKGYRDVELIDSNPMVIKGMTIPEILEEATRRGIAIK